MRIPASLARPRPRRPTDRTALQRTDTKKLAETETDPRLLAMLERSMERTRQRIERATCRLCGQDISDGRPCGCGFLAEHAAPEPTPFGPERAQEIWDARLPFLEIRDITPGENAYVRAVWDTLPGNSTWLTALHAIRAGTVK